MKQPRRSSVHRHWTDCAVWAVVWRRLDPSGPADRKKIALGTKPISLRAFRWGAGSTVPGGKLRTVVACCLAAFAPLSSLTATRVGLLLNRFLRDHS